MVLQLLKALGILTAATAVSSLFDHLQLSDVNIVMAYLIAVIIIAMITRLGIGIGASAASVLLFNFFFTEPKFTFSVYDSEYLFIFAVMFTVALITSTLTSKIKIQAAEAQKRETRTAALYRMSRTLLKANDEEEIIAAAQEIINITVPGKATILLSHAPRPIGDKLILIPLEGTSGRHGYIEYTQQEDSEELHGEDKSLIEALAAQVSLALDRERNARAHEKARVKAETEKNRFMILRSISHDLRTPLASIAGASSTLLEGFNSIQKETRRELLSTIYEESNWLAEVVENILSLSRLQSGLIRKNPEVLEDILFSAIERIRKRSGRRTIEVIRPEALIVLPMDGTLMEQALINILDNAVRYTLETGHISVQVRVDQEKNEVHFIIEDDGPGFKGNPLILDVDLFKSADTDRSRENHGAGLGLSICKAIVEAHRGTLIAENGKNKGARISIILPLGELTS